MSTYICVYTYIYIYIYTYIHIHIQPPRPRIPPLHSSWVSATPPTGRSQGKPLRHYDTLSYDIIIYTHMCVYTYVIIIVIMILQTRTRKHEDLLEDAAENSDGDPKTTPRNFRNPGPFLGTPRCSFCDGHPSMLTST